MKSSLFIALTCALIVSNQRALAFRKQRLGRASIVNPYLYPSLCHYYASTGVRPQFCSGVARLRQSFAGFPVQRVNSDPESREEINIDENNHDALSAQFCSYYVVKGYLPTICKHLLSTPDANLLSEIKNHKKNVTKIDEVVMGAKSEEEDEEKGYIEVDDELSFRQSGAAVLNTFLNTVDDEGDKVSNQVKKNDNKNEENDNANKEQSNGRPAKRPDQYGNRPYHQQVLSNKYNAYYPGPNQFVGQYPNFYYGTSGLSGSYSPYQYQYPQNYGGGQSFSGVNGGGYFKPAGSNIVYSNPSTSSSPYSSAGSYIYSGGPFLPIGSSRPFLGSSFGLSRNDGATDQDNQSVKGRDDSETTSSEGSKKNSIKNFVVPAVVGALAGAVAHNVFQRPQVQRPTNYVQGYPQFSRPVYSSSPSFSTGTTYYPSTSYYTNGGYSYYPSSSSPTSSFNSFGSNYPSSFGSSYPSSFGTSSSYPSSFGSYYSGSLARHEAHHVQNQTGNVTGVWGFGAASSETNEVTKMSGNPETSITANTGEIENVQEVQDLPQPIFLVPIYSSQNPISPQAYPFQYIYQGIQTPFVDKTYVYPSAKSVDSNPADYSTNTKENDNDTKAEDNADNLEIQSAPGLVHSNNLQQSLSKVDESDIPNQAFVELEVEGDIEVEDEDDKDDAKLEKKVADNESEENTENVTSAKPSVGALDVSDDKGSEVTKTDTSVSRKKRQAGILALPVSSEAYPLVARENIKTGSIAAGGLGFLAGYALANHFSQRPNNGFSSYPYNSGSYYSGYPSYYGYGGGSFIGSSNPYYTTRYYSLFY